MFCVGFFVDEVGEKKLNAKDEVGGAAMDSVRTSNDVKAADLKRLSQISAAFRTGFNHMEVTTQMKKINKYTHEKMKLGSAIERKKGECSKGTEVQRGRDGLNIDIRSKYFLFFSS